MIHSFGDSEVDEERFELRRKGSSVALQPKVLELLIYLVQRPDQLISKSELLGALWPEVSVNESSLTRLVSLARRALGDQAGQDSVIQTIPRRGYRFAAPVRRSGCGSVAEEVSERKLAAVLVADAVAYSRLMAEDEEATVRVLTAYRAEIVELVEKFRGRVVDFRGDDFLAEFGSAVDSVSCAVRIQEALRDLNAGLAPERRLEFRMGVHLGDVRMEAERIYGDGINIAARLQALAEPGGVCISGTARELVANQLDLDYEDLGEPELKNVSERVRAYRLLFGGGEAPTRFHSRVPARSAVAVLPFVNMSGNPEQEYLSDGIAEDLIIRLTQFGWFPVVARNSSFRYKGRAVDVTQLGRDLKVGYVVEGSVRRAGDRVRVNAQLVDATTGHHVWAHRYDREFRDVFSLQDELTEAIVASIEPRLWLAEGEQAAGRPAQNLHAWSCIQRGGWHVSRGTKRDLAQARALCQRALDLDRHLADAFYLLATTPHGEILLQWTEAPARPRADAVDLAQENAALTARDAHAQLALAAAHALTRRIDRMSESIDRAIQLDPGSAMAYRWAGLLLASLSSGEGDPAANDGLARVLAHASAIVYFALERHEDARVCAAAVPSGPDGFIAYGLQAASCAHLERIDEGRALLDEAARVHPEFSLAPLKSLLAAADPIFVERFDQALHRLGWTD